MNQRLQQFLSAENISQAQFADTIDVARASVSHVLAGRNKPGYDFIRSISEHYPALNIEWLITGKGKMYKQESPAPAPSSPAKLQESASTLFNDNLFDNEQIQEEPVVPKAEAFAKPVPEDAAPSIPAAPARSISRIIVFYDDNTFQELK